jgi:hypothetical protein
MAVFQESPHFREYVALLKQLRALISQSRGESEEAELLRDRMDGLWLHLSPEDIARIDAMAATGDLFREQVAPENWDHRADGSTRGRRMGGT